MFKKVVHFDVGQCAKVCALGEHCVLLFEIKDKSNLVNGMTE